jgi:hypothetical protein
VNAVEMGDGSVHVTWDATAYTALAVVEFNPAGQAGFLSFGEGTADDGFLDGYPNGPQNAAFRVKFVQGTDESAYTEASLRLTFGGYYQPKMMNYLPLVMR